ncbi:MAG: FHA domain-containing protein [Hyphomicrobiaceae bacterium]|nr:MAG: FHA domain-containing protein [Hyphomicrobiaceae bacterium]
MAFPAALPAMFLPSWSVTILQHDLGMPPVNTTAVLLAVALPGAMTFACVAHAEIPVPGIAGAADAQSIYEQWRALASAVAHGVAVLEDGYRRVPALVVVLSAIVLLPAVALVSLAVHRAARTASWRLARRPAAVEWTRGPRPGPDVPAWPAQAWLSIEGEAMGARPIAGEMVRIGRHKDNEIALPHASVHRYHAVIRRTEDSEFVITDLSGREGNGVRINGKRTAQAQLADGDVIELGKARMTFASVPV